MADYANFEPTDEWAKSNAGMSLADFYKSNPSYANGGGNTGSYDTLLKGLPKSADLANNVTQNENNVFSDYLKTVQSQPKSVDFYKGQLNEAGIPQLQKTASSLQGQIYDTEDALRKLEPDVTATTGNSMVTDAQRRGIIQARSQPLNENLNTLTTGLGRVSSAIQQGKSDAIALTNLNSADQAKLVDAYKTKLDLATTQGSRALQALQSDINNTLNISLAKLHRGEQLSDTEAANAFELLKMSKDAELKIQENSSKKDNEIVEIGGHKYLVDKNTGQKTDLGSTSSGGSAGGAADYYKTSGSTTNYGGGNSDWEVVPEYGSILDYNNYRMNNR